MTDTIVFREYNLGISRKRIGIPVGNLVIVPEYMQNNDMWHIYSLISCSKFFNPKIQGRENAIKIAELLNEIYGEYILISKAWPEADIISISRYSVRFGRKIAAIHELDETLNLEKFRNFFEILV